MPRASKIQSPKPDPLQHSDHHCASKCRNGTTAQRQHQNDEGTEGAPQSSSCFYLLTIVLGYNGTCFDVNSRWCDTRSKRVQPHHPFLSTWHDEEVTSGMSSSSFLFNTMQRGGSSLLIPSLRRDTTMVDPFSSIWCNGEGSSPHPSLPFDMTQRDVYPSTQWPSPPRTHFHHHSSFAQNERQRHDRDKVSSPTHFIFAPLNPICAGCILHVASLSEGNGRYLHFGLLYNILYWEPQLLDWRLFAGMSKRIRAWRSGILVRGASCGNVGWSSKSGLCFFTMAKVLSGRTCWFSAEFSSYSSPVFDRYDDERVMEFIPMQLSFFDGPSGESSPQPPIFSRVTEFRVTGVVMNVFLLDPSERLLSAFIWFRHKIRSASMHCLTGTRKNVFIDTKIECVSSA